MTSPRLLAATVLLLVAIAGGLAGIALDRAVLLPARFGHGYGGGPPGARRPLEPDRRSRDRFAHQLGLSDSQRVRIDSLMDRQLQQIRAVRAQVHPRFDSIVTQTRREIDAILTPEQREKAKKLGPPPR